jgi:protein gp37
VFAGLVNRFFISIEPLTGPAMYNQCVAKGAEKVIVGPMTGPSATPPKQEWIDHLKSWVPKGKIFFKKGL